MSFTRRSFAASALALPLAAQKSKTSEKAPEATPEEAAEFKIFTRHVVAPTTVIDRNGNYVNDLHTQDFRLVDWGVEQKIRTRCWERTATRRLSPSTTGFG